MQAGINVVSSNANANQLRPRRPILVTGSHRSGSTWVGKMISASPSVGYISEPLNWETHSLGVCGARIPCWFPYITKENESDYREHIRAMLEFRYHISGGLKGIRSLQDIKRVRWEYKTFRLYRSRNVRPLLKDPFAVFSAVWFARTFGANVVVMIRHPAAFASSLKRLNWPFPFSHFLRQPALMRDYLCSFEKQIREHAEHERDIIDQAILLWRIIYHVVAEHHRNHGDWVFLRHEDVSQDPVRGFRDLFLKLGLRFTSHVERVVSDYTNSANPAEVAVESSFTLRRHSRSAIQNWKKRLSASEIARIRKGTEDVANGFYLDDDW